MQVLVTTQMQQGESLSFTMPLTTQGCMIRQGGLKNDGEWITK